MDWRRFIAAVFIGRFVRFSAEAYLAVRVGDRAMETLQRHYPMIAVALALGVVVFVVARNCTGGSDRTICVVVVPHAQMRDLFRSTSCA